MVRCALKLQSPGADFILLPFSLRPDSQHGKTKRKQSHFPSQSISARWKDIHPVNNGFAALN